MESAPADRQGGRTSDDGGIGGCVGKREKDQSFGSPGS